MFALIITLITAITIAATFFTIRHNNTRVIRPTTNTVAPAFTYNGGNGGFGSTTNQFIAITNYKHDMYKKYGEASFNMVDRNLNNNRLGFGHGITFGN